VGDKPKLERNKMKAKRKRHEPEFKARVALEALKGVRTIQQIAKEYQIHPVQVSEWKKIMLEGAAEAFGPGRARTAEEDFDRERKKLQAKIGELTIDVDWLREKSKQLGL
jgi:transposase/putative transposase